MFRNTIFLTVIILNFHLLGQLQALEGTFVVPKSFASVMNNTWKIPARSLRSAPLVLDANDTIAYTLVRERQRRISLSIDAAKNQIPDIIVQDNMLIGVYVVKEAGTYLFKIKNRSFLSNTVFFEVKKNVPKPALPDQGKSTEEKKDSTGTSTKPTMVQKDTLLASYDSVHYVACSFNLKQPSVLSLPLDSIDAYYYFVTTSSNIALLDSKGNPILLKGCEKTQKSSEIVKDRAKLIIYACAKHASTKSFGKHDCLVKLPEGALAKNEDKVVGKALHIQVLKLKSIVKPNTP